MLNLLYLDFEPSATRLDIAYCMSPMPEDGMSRVSPFCTHNAVISGDSSKMFHGRRHAS